MNEYPVLAGDSAEDFMPTYEELKAENDKMFKQILDDLKEINEMTSKTVAILKEVEADLIARL